MTIITKIKGFFGQKRLKELLILLLGVALGATSFKVYDNYTNKSFLTQFIDNQAKLYAKDLDLSSKMKDFESINSEFAKIFEDSDKFEAEFQKHFENQRKIMDKMIRESHKNIEKTGYNSSVSRSVNEKSVSYILDFTGYDASDIDVEIKDDMLTFRALKEGEQKNQYFGSKFAYSYSTPKYEKKPKITRNKNNIIVEFDIIDKKTN